MKHVVIIGNGIAGITAAREIRKRADHRITVISAESDHFFSRTALMYIYMGHLTYDHTKPYEDHFWAKNRIDLRRAWVERVDTDERSVVLSGGDRLGYDALVIATGSKSNRFGWPGQDLPGVQGLYSLQDLQRMEDGTRDVKSAVVVGGGLIGVEMAEMLRSRDIPVTFLVRESSWMDFAFPAPESQLINREVAAHVELRLGTELKEVEAGSDGRACAVHTSTGERIEAGFVGLTVGVSPNVAFLRDSGIELDRGVLVDEQLRTNRDDVYAIGDCAQLRQPPPGRRAIEALWYVGRAMGQTLARTLCGEPTRYTPARWFNSAKFFDLEYQVYGEIPPTLPDGVQSLYWEDAKARRSVRINYRARGEGGAVLGFNLMGVRYRHEQCDRWLGEAADIRFVLEHLGALNFDPEFASQPERHLVALFNEQNPKAHLKLKRRRGLWRRAS